MPQRRLHPARWGRFAFCGTLVGMTCREDMTVRIGSEMRTFAQKLVGAQPLPFWAESAMRQHAEYAANDWCSARGLSGAPEAPTLPSIGAAEAFLLGEPGGTARVLGWTLRRAALIGLGLFAVGQRRGVVKGALAGAVAIEAFVLWTVRQQLKDAGRLASVSERR